MFERDFRADYLSRGYSSPLRSNMMENINIEYESPEAAQYLSRLPSHKIQNMARVCQLLKNNGLDDMIAQQQQHQHQPLSHAPSQRSHNVLRESAFGNNNNSMVVQQAQWRSHNIGSGSKTHWGQNVGPQQTQWGQNVGPPSTQWGQTNIGPQSAQMQSQWGQSTMTTPPQWGYRTQQWNPLNVTGQQSIAHLTGHHHNIVNVSAYPAPENPRTKKRTLSSGSSLESYPYVLSSNPRPPAKTPNKKTPKKSKTTLSCIRRSLHLGKENVLPEVALEKKVESERQAESEKKERGHKRRSTISVGLCGQGDIEGVVKPKADNVSHIEVEPKEHMVMGKAILKLSILSDHGILAIHVDKAKHLQAQTTPLCNSFVRVCLLPATDNRASTTTEMVLQTNHPAFDEKLSVKVGKEDRKKRLYISVWQKRYPTDLCSEFLGSMSFGVANIISSNRVVEGWYYLLQEDIGCRKHLKAILKKA